MTTKPTRTGDAIDAFIASRVGASPKYVEGLRYRLGKLEKAHPDALPDTPEQLEQALHKLTGIGDETRLMIWTAWRRMYQFLWERYHVRNPMLKVRRPPTRAKELAAFTPAEAGRLIFTHRFKHRENAVLMLMLDTGARLGEVAGLRPQDLGHNSVRLGANPNRRGKTGTRTVPISPQTAKALMSIAGDADAPTIWAGKQGPLTTHGVQTMIKRCIKNAGLQGGPHKLRHTFARLYLDDGGSIARLMAIMGHKNLKTTERYLRESPEASRADHTKHSPISRLSPENRQSILELVVNE